MPVEEPFEAEQLQEPMSPNTDRVWGARAMVAV